MVKAHTPINWENEPSYNTPVNEVNLNQMDSTIGILDDRIITLDVTKLDKATANNMVKSISLDESTGIFTITYLNGSTTTIDTKLEKISINFDYDVETQQIILELIDGTKQYIDISSLISPVEFINSETIGVETTDDGKVKAKVLDGSITEDMLQPNYLADIKVESAKAETNATKSQSYAVGGTNSRENEEIDNAKYYYEQSKSISESFSGALLPMGTVAFENLPSLEDSVSGWMYNISNEFVTTDDFKEGAGYSISLGTNIFKTADGFWDVLAGSPVTGVKGNSETSYRRGNVNITKANVGLGNVDNTSDADKPISTATQTALNGKLATNGDSESNTVTFTSNDVTDGSAEAWTSVTKLTSGITHATFFQRVSQMFKNVRYLYKMLGTTDISAIGDGTVTGGLSTLNSNLIKHNVFGTKQTLTSGVNHTMTSKGVIRIQANMSTNTWSYIIAKVNAMEVFRIQSSTSGQAYVVTQCIYVNKGDVVYIEKDSSTVLNNCEFFAQ